ncbi:glycoside hydrolase family 19 protein [Aggregatibacter actinomycetemcomitans]|uniref:glycoside hydrolase family 19 protein n=1 Tax=Aggregatibacter actinomycetemcomitans TaxID=714 RepID=UPI00197BE5AB|nr:glycoside hydrolase family 19 protein [Aggregatibacter actinomycetemcomitans]MBN6069421.1 glycoside hydrolase family 19 protein [Aggregatibacter actinomycetemcomitans]MBN6087083.1 glycoside hydrolase family 19 protein [Aggregatibacter actinomycetemcomitans]
MIISESKFKRVFPRAVDGVYQTIADYAEEYGLDTKQKEAMFLAQCGHETAGFTCFTENLNYSADGLLRVFPKYFNKHTAQQYARKPEAIANRVYASRMNNGDEASGDGWKYRGRGIIQVTGKKNYQAFQSWVGERVTPESLTTEMDLCVLAGFWYWSVNGLDKISDIVAVTKLINGGTNGLSDRKALYANLLG